MLKIDFEKIFIDLGLYDAFKKILKENTPLSDKQITEFLNYRIHNHGKKAHDFLDQITELQQKKKTMNSEEQKDIDSKLDEMIKDFENNYKQSQNKK